MPNMILKAPLIITSRLLAGIKIGKGDTAGTISIEKHNKKNHEGKPIWSYYIDLANGYECKNNDLAGWGNLQAMLESLLSFLYACGEAYGYNNMQFGRHSENIDLFPPKVAEWCYLNRDEITMMQLELQETPNLVEE